MSAGQTELDCMSRGVSHGIKYHAFGIQNTKQKQHENWINPIESLQDLVL